MTRLTTTLLSTLLLAVGAAAQAASFEAGKNYTVIPQAQRTNVAPGKVEVMEVFSYGCPACNAFRSFMRKLKSSLPANAQLVYLPASWHPEENWPLLQRAYYTAQAMGVASAGDFRVPGGTGATWRTAAAARVRRWRAGR